MVPYLIGGVAAWGAVVGGLYLLQEEMIFPRAVARTPLYPLPPRSERIELVNPEGFRLVGNLVRARGPSRGLVLGFPGNAWNADDCTTFLAARLWDFDVAVFHYRGYAPSEGEPSEKALFADAEFLFDTLTFGLAPERTYAFGASLGSGVAAWLASRRPLAGLVLVTPFDSLEAIARARYPFAPVRWLLKHPFRSDRYLADRDIPVAVIAAGEDRVVPRRHTEALLRVLVRPVLVRTIPGASHSGIYDTPEIDELLRHALAALEQATRLRAAAE